MLLKPPSFFGCSKVMAFWCLCFFWLPVKAQPEPLLNHACVDVQHLPLVHTSTPELVADYARAVSIAFSQIALLQDAINAGQLRASDIERETLLGQFHRSFQGQADMSFDTRAPGLLGYYRQSFIQAYMQVIDTYRDFMITGGPDAFVPAFFRAELLAELNQRLDGRIFAVASMTDAELVNLDSSVNYLMRGLPTQQAAQQLLQERKTEMTTLEVGGRFLRYQPMVLAPGCVACHERNGVFQEVGGYGGALIIDARIDEGVN